MHASANDRYGKDIRPLGLPSPCRNAAKELRITRGQTLFFEGDPATYFFEILTGTVRCCRLISDGRRQIHRFARARDMLGLSGEAIYGFSAEAVTEVTVRRHHLADLNAAMMEDAVLSRRVLQALRDELAATRTQMMLLGRMCAVEKLACFLLALAGRRSSPEDRVELPMTRGDIADHLGLTIETVSRKIHELCSMGVIQLEAPTRFRIVDFERMEALAEAA